MSGPPLGTFKGRRGYIVLPWAGDSGHSIVFACTMAIIYAYTIAIVFFFAGLMSARARGEAVWWAEPTQGNREGVEGRRLPNDPCVLH